MHTKMGNPKIADWKLNESAKNGKGGEKSNPS